MKVDEEQIRELAYWLWVQRGWPSGGAEEDWLAAERSLNGLGAVASSNIESAPESFSANGDENRAGLARKTKRRSKAAAAAESASGYVAKETSHDESRSA